MPSSELNHFRSGSVGRPFLCSTEYLLTRNLMSILTVVLAWFRFGRAVVSLSTLLLAGIYAFRKIPIYAAFLVRRQVTWIRSKRDGEHAD